MPVASARPVPNAAVPPVLAIFPETRAVSGVPDVALKPPVKDQPVKALVFHPPLRHNPRTPTGEESVYCTCSRWRWSNVERPRSSARFCGFCATTLPPPPKLDALSIDLESV